MISILGKVKNTSDLKMGCSLVLLLMVVYIVLSAICWPYTINSWLIFFGKAPVVVWWQGLLVGFVPYVNKMAFPLAFVTWLIMLFI